MYVMQVVVGVTRVACGDDAVKPHRLTTAAVEASKWLYGVLDASQLGEGGDIRGRRLGKLGGGGGGGLGEDRNHCEINKTEGGGREG